MRTLIIINSVERACELNKFIRDQYATKDPQTRFTTPGTTMIGTQYDLIMNLVSYDRADSYIPEFDTWLDHVKNHLTPGGKFFNPGNGEGVYWNAA